MRSRILFFPIGALAVALVLVGCGGGGDADPLSKTAFVKQGNAICVNAAKEREAAMAAAAKKNGKEVGSENIVSEVVLPPTQKMVDELDDLGVPNGDEEQVEEMISGFEEGIEAVEADPKEALGSSAFEKANKAALAYGLTECAI